MVRRSATGLELVLHKGCTQTLHRPIHTDTRMIAASARSSAGSCWAIAVRKGTMPLVVVAERAALALAMAAVWAGMAEARGVRSARRRVWWMTKRTSARDVLQVIPDVEK